MTERGTLAQLGVKEGDVVKSRGGYTYTVAISDNGGFYDAADFGKLSSSHDFTIIYRATPPIDLTTNTSAYGLCSDEWKAAMQAHVDAGGEVEWFSNVGWRSHPTTEFLTGLTYRAKPTPVTITQTVTYPKPLTKALADGQTYYSPDPQRESMHSIETWDGGEMDHLWLKRGLIYLTETDAVTRAKSMMGGVE